MEDNLHEINQKILVVLSESEGGFVELQQYLRGMNKPVPAHSCFIPPPSDHRRGFAEETEKKRSRESRYWKEKRTENSGSRLFLKHFLNWKENNNNVEKGKQWVKPDKSSTRNPAMKGENGSTNLVQITAVLETLLELGDGERNTS
nr:hypothetical protein Iba_chr01dCG8830 [Ipomoea batatas]GME08262.1 hypothetical protein Iba_scaffold7395CG0010 [Ipomoea batatas]